MGIWRPESTGGERSKFGGEWVESGNSPGDMYVGESGSDRSGLLLGVKTLENSNEYVGDGGSSFHLRLEFSNIFGSISKTLFKCSGSISGLGGGAGGGSDIVSSSQRACGEEVEGRKEEVGGGRKEEGEEGGGRKEEGEEGGGRRGGSGS